MKISRDAVLEMFEELEYTTASKWKKEQLLGKIQRLPDLPDETLEKIVKSKQTFESLLTAIDEDDDIEITASKKPTKKVPGKKKELTTKDKVYKIWCQNPEKFDAEKAFEKFDEAVKIGTIRCWSSGWKGGRGLPRCAAEMATADE